MQIKNKFILDIRTGLNPCASRCRLCQLAHTKPSKITFDRFKSVINKFYEFKLSQKLDNMSFLFWDGYSLNSDIHEFSEMYSLHEKVGEWKMKALHLGGIHHMETDDIRKWLYDRKNIGSEYTSASYFGFGEDHNYWSNRKNDFQFLLDTQRIAAEIDLINEVHIFLLNSTLQNLPRLLETIDKNINNVRECIIFPPYYSGLARKYEKERLTSEQIMNLPITVKQYLRSDFKTWKTEKEWVEYVRLLKDSEKIRLNNSHFTIELNDKNIDYIESHSCEDILTDLFKRTFETYNQLPPISLLAEKYSDIYSDKVYMYMWDMESLWLDRYLKENPTDFERKLTYFGR
ncbi:hypothetical protein [Sulfuricurvum sp.]|uniref:hypothetical protein n=1 Tax=Sulfuricurvum sp. TaxID=2025608 RepID=UPI00262DD699|nr:hypothetical protein [Sulfuricurvum sp.]MDD3597716.1 hypothetical protein [Sulfuricurvum sp.]